MNTPIGFRSRFTEGAATTRPGTLTLDAGASMRWTEGVTVYRFDGGRGAALDRGRRRRRVTR